ncbi:MAG: WxcM-like domain-containing protein [Thermoplasmata archaeon]
MIISGEIYEDFRGKMRLLNDFDLKSIVRMYCIEPNVDIIRAWQGHKFENKWFFASRGSFEVKIINMKSGKKSEYLLTDKRSEILHITAGNYNGFKALEEGSLLIVFSDFTLEQSKSDDYRVSLDQIAW